MGVDGGKQSGRKRGSPDIVAAVVVIAFTGLVVGGLFYLGGTDTPNSAAGESDAAESEPLNRTAAERAIAAAINRERTARDLDPVAYRSGLAGVARNHSSDMIARDYYAHESPDGETPFDRVEDSAVSCSSVGENIAASWWQRVFESADGERTRHTTPEELADGLVEQWLDSPEHRENLLDPDWERTGVGVAVTAEGEVLVTQNFCE
jgi:uncharacterized protein YkwD